MAVLANQLITAPDAEPARWIIVAHGIFGRGQNWRTIARKLCERRPDWGAVLVDLRGHGRSSNLREPATLAAAAEDIVDTARAHAASRGPVRALVGHSFGGKVVLAARSALNLALTWVIDASPGRNPAAITDPAATAPAALARLEDLAARSPEGFADRDGFVSALGDSGVARGVAQFLAMNLARGDDNRFHLAIDLAAIRALLTDYFATELWGELDRPELCPVHVAVASRQSALSADDLGRLETLARGGAEVVVHRVTDSGHWIHADAPEALLELLVGSLAEPGAG